MILYIETNLLVLRLFWFCSVEPWATNVLHVGV